MRLLVVSIFIFAQTCWANNIEQCVDTLLSEELSSEQIDSTLYEFCVQRGYVIPAEQKNILNYLEITQEQSLDRAYAIQKFFSATEKSTNSTKLDKSEISLLVEQLELTSNIEPQSLWERFINWLKTLRKEPTDNEYEWLDKLADWLSQFDIPDWIFTFIFRGSIILLITMAIVFIVYELRQNGVFLSKQKHKDTSHGALSASDSGFENALDWEKIRSLPLPVRFRSIFQLLLQNMITLKYLPDDPSKTTTELSNYLVKNNFAYVSDFKELSNYYADHIYGSKLVNNESVDSFDKRVRALINKYE